MTKRAAAVAAVCGFASIAWAAIPGSRVKIKEFVPSGPGAVENPDADGTAHLTYNAVADVTEIRVTIVGFLPNTVYGVSINSNGLNDQVVDNLAILTNPAGNGSWRYEALQNQLPNVSVTIFRYNGDFLNADTVSPDEVRAVGQP